MERKQLKVINLEKTGAIGVVLKKRTAIGWFCLKLTFCDFETNNTALEKKRPGIYNSQFGNESVQNEYQEATFKNLSLAISLESVCSIKKMTAI